jgi:hypothetical protein
MQEKAPRQSEPPTDSDFKAYVLYVPSSEKRDPLSVKALDTLTANPGLKLETMIQITDNLREKPAWMSVLPVIVSKTEKRAYSGAACVEFIAQAQSSVPHRSKRRGCDARAAWS